MEKYQVELRELIFNNILQNGTKDSESTLDVQWRLDTLNTNKIFAGCFNFFRKWKVKKNQITLIEKLNTGGTGSLFEIKTSVKKEGYLFILISLRMQIMK